MALSKGTKGLLLVKIVIIGGLFLSKGRSDAAIIGISVLATFLLVAVANRLFTGRNTETIFSGLVLGLIEAYHFLIQPNMTDYALPELPEHVALYFGIMAATRALILLFEYADTPLKKPVRGLLGK